MTFNWWQRWGPLAGIVSTILFVVALFVTTNQDTGKPDSEILAHFAKHSNQVRDLVSFFVFFAAVFFLLLFLASLRTRLLAAEGEPGPLTALAFGSGVAAAVQLIVSFAFFAGPGVTELDTDRFKLDPNTFRLLNNTGYGIFISGVMTASLLVWAASALAIRTGVLPRWFGWLGVLVGLLLLAAFAFIPVFLLWAWVLVASVLLLWRPAVARVPAAP
jgi:hypothetical protein